MGGFGSIERNIEDELLNSRMRRRKPGHIPYPFKYSPAMASFDIWDHMFIASCCKSLTTYQFEKPPEMILDLGCGTGYWAMEAAKQWPKSTIVGFDIAKIQPPLGLLRDYRPIASRVKWVHGNFLDGLPFPEAHFDFVRIVGIGLAVPEDEWQHLLEEAFRVMKPGAVIEIIEEDLLFPCATLPQRKQGFSPINVSSSPLEPTVPLSTSSITLCSSSSDEKSILSPAGSAYSPLTLPFPTGLPLLSSSTVNTYTEPPQSYEDDDEENCSSLQNHNRLKMSWESMLSSRFICAKLVSVLPFYISSASFVSMHSHPPCRIPLPPNSGRSRQGKIHLVYEDFCQPIASLVQEKDSWDRMHLAKTVNTIKAAKEAIWQEYAKLFPKGSVTIRFNLGGTGAISSNSSSREAFESDWKNWENDMTDRIAMRNSQSLELSWSEPKGERPDWRTWRGHLEKERSPRDSGYSSLRGDPEDVCRSLAGFVAWKPTNN